MFITKSITIYADKLDLSILFIIDFFIRNEIFFSTQSQFGTKTGGLY